MLDEARPLDQQQPLKLATDFLGEDRHEFVERLAYKLWEQGGGRSARRTSTGSQRNKRCMRHWQRRG